MKMFRIEPGSPEQAETPIHNSKPMVRDDFQPFGNMLILLVECCIFIRSQSRCGAYLQIEANLVLLGGRGCAACPAAKRSRFRVVGLVCNSKPIRGGLGRRGLRQSFTSVSSHPGIPRRAGDAGAGSAQVKTGVAEILFGEW